MLCAQCASISRRCTGSATISSSSMRPRMSRCCAPSGCAPWVTAAPAVGFDQALVLERPRRAGHGGVLPHLQLPTATRSSSAATARAASPRSSTAAAWRATAQLTLDSPAGTGAGPHRRAGAASRWTWACRTSTPARCPFEAPREADSYALEVAGQTVEIGAVSHGQPARGADGDSAVDAAPVATLGPAIEHHPRFPRRVNAGFLRDRGARRRCGCASMSVAPARRSAAAPAPARRSRWRAAAGCWTRTCAWACAAASYA